VIRNVLRIGVQEQMSRVDAARRVARVANDQPVWNGTYEKLIGSSVRGNQLVIEKHYAVSARALGPLPEPASTARKKTNTTEKCFDVPQFSRMRIIDKHDGICDLTIHVKVGGNPQFYVRRDGQESLTSQLGPKYSTAISSNLIRGLHIQASALTRSVQTHRPQSRTAGRRFRTWIDTGLASSERSSSALSPVSRQMRLRRSTEAECLPLAIFQIVGWLTPTRRASAA
jgi:hypothetical protein